MDSSQETSTGVQENSGDDWDDMYSYEKAQSDIARYLEEQREEKNDLEARVNEIVNQMQDIGFFLMKHPIPTLPTAVLDALREKDQELADDKKRLQYVISAVAEEIDVCIQEMKIEKKTVEHL